MSAGAVKRAPHNWKDFTPPKVGSVWFDKHSGSKIPRYQIIKVMAYVDGYVVAAKPGSIPILMDISSWHWRFKKLRP